jgi:hypothetical protein
MSLRSERKLNQASTVLMAAKTVVTISCCHSFSANNCVLEVETHVQREVSTAHDNMKWFPLNLIDIKVLEVCNNAERLVACALSATSD